MKRKPSAREALALSLRRVALHGPLLVTHGDTTAYTLADDSGSLQARLARRLIKAEMLIPVEPGLFDGSPQSYRARTPRDLP
jgi:hypothetical protein